MTAYKNPNLPALFINELVYPDLRKFDRDLLSTLQEWSRNLENILQRGLSFSDNVDCRLVTFTSSATPDAENTVPHALGKIPIGFIPYDINKAGIVYRGTTTFTKTNLYLKVNVASVAVKILVF